jgi:hypothetical protein
MSGIRGRSSCNGLLDFGSILLCNVGFAGRTHGGLAAGRVLGIDTDLSVDLSVKLSGLLLEYKERNREQKPKKKSSQMNEDGMKDHRGRTIFHLVGIR